ncbi:MAG TPA: TonB-dependent receptor plug domain-containing protein, partial [Candidatus Methanoperedens sp.]|nr:TonB-dependent receptor plug domain-containing protein [Candidatus Methanoperedens sp.]
MSMARMKLKVTGLMLIALAVAGGAAAQQRQPVQTEPVVVTATRTPVPAGGASGSLELVTAAQIEAAAATDVKAALGLIPSLVCNDAGGPAAVATLSLRGSTSQQVLVLLDGKRLANAQSSFFNLNDLPVPIERVERIEVLPTPASALYGADALGGVVNIITRPAGTTPGMRAGYGQGTDGEERLSGGVQYGIGKLGLSLDGRLHSGDGFRENGDFDLTNVVVAATMLPAPWGLDVRWTTLERDAGVPGPAAFPSPHARQEDQRDALRADFTYRPQGSWDVVTGVST